MYRLKVFRFKKSIDYEYSFAGNFGAKGEKRQARKKVTPQQIETQNQRNREKKMWRLLRANFEEGDLWVTLKYFKGERPPVEEVKKDISTLLRKMRAAYKARDEDLKFIYRMEIGELGGIHIHIVMNRIGDTDKILVKYWKKPINITPLYSTGELRQLAGYIVKQEEEADRQLTLFDESDRKKLLSVSSSRNLIRPEPEKKEYTRRTMRKILEQGPVPTPGYYIDVDTVYSGINPYTGESYFGYTEVKIERKGERHGSDG